MLFEENYQWKILTTICYGGVSNDYYFDDYCDDDDWSALYLKMICSFIDWEWSFCGFKDSLSEGKIQLNFNG